MAFQQGLSGLNAAAKALDVISNNVANGSTVGYKLAGAQFGDVFAAALNGAAAGVQIGIGTSMSQVSQQFTQGNITPTNNPLDVAINGDGFFIVQSPDATVTNYSRNGQFDIDANGFIVNASGYKLMGFLPGGGSTTASAIQLSASNSSLTGAPAATTAMNIGINLDSRNTTPTLTPFDYTNTSTYNSSTASTAYDSLGNPHAVTMYFVRSASAPSLAGASSRWDVYTSIDNGAPSATPGNMEFSSAGSLIGTSAVGTYTFNSSFPVTTGATTPLAFTLNMAGSTQYGSTFNVTSQTQDGYAPGTLSGITISKDGIVQGRYSNGQTTDIATIALATFASPNGLLSVGSNFWAESAESGAAQLGAPGIGKRGLLQAGAVEESNVDLTAELVNMITQQRNYQANAQSIKTQDQVMQTLVNLR
ncbi:flagellar hook protein FlgE [Uliginosibacterium sp. H3]|uniref:Flagellar hook protein FlgE n=1 Tax=Uliginosibacterium silvisoli TaxID=3114758 RepID=A0ABU6K8Q7_9RHOO|nr:flagellar hook protein FlgE [Uliginosibacterium sp. H3]